MRLGSPQVLATGEYTALARRLRSSLILHDVAKVGSAGLGGLLACRALGRLPAAPYLPELRVDLSPDIDELKPVALTMIFKAHSADLCRAFSCRKWHSAVVLIDMLAWRLKLGLLLGTLLASLLAGFLAWNRLTRLFLAREAQSIHDELLGWHAIFALISLTVF